MATRYALGTSFPYEGFVQEAIERHFRSFGYVEETKGHVDLACRHPQTGQAWVVEAKGETSQVGLDFRTGLGQLLQRMSDPEATHALAVPDTPKFRLQVEAVPAWVREALGLHWLLVGETGQVDVISPDEP